jgi:hypothetical protein
MKRLPTAATESLACISHWHGAFHGTTVARKRLVVERRWMGVCLKFSQAGVASWTPRENASLLEEASDMARESGLGERTTHVDDIHLGAAYAPRAKL